VDPADPKGRDDVQVLNEIHVPVNKPVIAYISSKDVIHSFKLLAMRVTQDAIPGMRVPIWFKPVKEGKYQIYCAQLCGNGHANMAGGVVVVESQDAYDKWVASKAGAATSFE
jgi:cytochrome c oxidase subunit 2